MDAMKVVVSPTGLVLSLSGHVDSNNANEVEAALNQARKEHPEGGLSLDCEKLEYISSAGLRVILRLSKTEPTLRLVNVSSAVFEVLEMTGFAEMIPVEKAFRTLSIEGCEMIGQGAMAKFTVSIPIPSLRSITILMPFRKSAAREN